MQILRTDWKGLGKFAGVAKALNAIGRIINDIVGENGIEAEYRGGRLVISSDGRGGGGGGAFPWGKLAFGWSLHVVTAEEAAAGLVDAAAEPPVEGGWAGFDEGDVVCIIRPGEVRMHGAHTYRIVNDYKVKLTGAKVIVVVLLNRTEEDSQALSIESGLLFFTDANYMRLPLYTFEQNDGGSYALKTIHHMGDFDFAAPIR